jgi:hypothetical protein
MRRASLFEGLLQQAGVEEAHNMIVAAVLGDMQRCFVAVAQMHSHLHLFGSDKRQYLFVLLWQQYGAIKQYVSNLDLVIE